jgi:L,D-transpeptidase catalytic domain
MSATQARRFWLSLVIGLVVVLARAAPADAQAEGAQAEDTPSEDASGPIEVQALDNPAWALALEPATLRSQPNDDSEAFATLRPLAPLEILGFAGDWAYVYNPRTKGTAYVKQEQLGPGDPPSSYVDLEPPPIEEELDKQGRVSEDTPLSFFPASDEAAAYTQLTSGSSVEITGSLHDDGEEWYRTADGDYLPASAVAFPSAPAVPAFTVAPPSPVRTFAGRWIDVNLNLPAHLTAYEGGIPVRSMLVIFGRLGTPTGTFSIIRRVANETMDSSTIGIPRNGPGGYYLKNVLFTQYFLPGGQSIHYNYWSSSWGYPGSHGCLGLSYADSAFMWSFSSLGTPVSIHY